MIVSGLTVEVHMNTKPSEQHSSNGTAKASIIMKNGSSHFHVGKEARGNRKPPGKRSTLEHKDWSILVIG